MILIPTVAVAILAVLFTLEPEELRTRCRLRIFCDSLVLGRKNCSAARSASCFVLVFFFYFGDTKTRETGTCRNNLTVTIRKAARRGDLLHAFGIHPILEPVVIGESTATMGPLDLFVVLA